MSRKERAKYLTINAKQLYKKGIKKIFRERLQWLHTNI